MQCPRCHAENREGRRFCGECGLSFAATCASCGFLNEGSEKFCGGCGRAPAPAPPRRARSWSPAAESPAMPPPKKTPSLRGRLEGDSKPVTVLFCDLVSST